MILRFINLLNAKNREILFKIIIYFRQQCKVTYKTSPDLRLENMDEAHCNHHYSDVIMSGVASQITSVSSVYSNTCSGADRRNHQSSASLAFVRGIHRWPVDSPHKGPVTRKNVNENTNSLFRKKQSDFRAVFSLMTVKLPQVNLGRMEYQDHKIVEIKPSKNRIVYIYNGISYTDKTVLGIV